MKKYLKNVYDAGTIAFHYTILYSLYLGPIYRIGDFYMTDSYIKVLNNSPN